MNLSYWEIKSWLTNIDYTVVGSGIVGLSCALQLKQKFPKARILVLEKGYLPQGASTKNAGFACFGSLSEIVDDLQSHSEEEVFNLVKERVEGLQLLRETLGDDTMDYQMYGGYELFTDDRLIEECKTKEHAVNVLLRPLFNDDVFSFKPNYFGFENCSNDLSYNQYEAQIDTGKMMVSLLDKAFTHGIMIINSVIVQSYTDELNSVHVNTDKFDFKTSKLLLATNGFAAKLINENVKPARAQVLVTKPIKDLKIKGTFHLDRGYYYFRNIDNRILFGGGRNLDFKGEETTDFNQTELIQNKLEELLATTIIPNTPFEIEQRWSGIMGVGSKKKPIIKQLSDNAYCGVRMGGMGVAIGSLIGKKLSALL